MRTARSLRFALAGGVTVKGSGRLLISTTVTPGPGGAMLGKEDSATEICSKGSTTNSERSGVEIMVLAVDTARQCFKVSSQPLVSYRPSHMYGQQLPRRLVFIIADMAPILDNARTVINISGEFVVNTATISLRRIPCSLKNAARRMMSIVKT